MGAWGVKALESDAGLDVVDFLEMFYKGKTKLVLSDILVAFIVEGFLGQTRAEIDFYFDNTAIALTELYLMFQETGELDYDHEDECISLRKKTAFVSDPESLELLFQYLMDIKNEKPDEDGEREFVELWKDSPSYEKWKAHLENLSIKLKKELN
ncbi:MAG: Unknown protein [uncultured Aureispira sp.]|uniref:DUF4259 domain-containing protein n=1 Tax=uncultured Aureispira sp. TaxID=1331704 RepID=A0A6S6TTB9_9BACT|nr:MAG: Unknown protein [uncultured Aureispira sp.]